MYNLKLKSLLLFVAFFTLIGSFVSAAYLDGSYISSQHTNCNGGVFPVVYYAGKQDIAMTDTFSSSDTNYVWLFKSSNFYVYNPYNLLKVNTSLSSLFPFYSNGKPNNVTTVVVTRAANGGIDLGTNIPSGISRNTLISQIVFEINRSFITGKPGSQNNLTYLTLGSSTQKTFSWDIVTTNFNNGNVSDYECRNIYIGFCGDGILDNSSTSNSSTITTKLNGGEVCDPADITKTNWGNGGCSISCQPITLTQKPTCTLDLDKNEIYLGERVNIAWNILGIYTNSPQIGVIPGITGFPYSVTTSNGTKQNITPSSGGTYNFSMTVSNSAGSNVCTDTLLVNYCGDGELNGNEICDYNDSSKAGRGNGGCSISCQPISLQGDILITKKLIGDAGYIYNFGDVVYFQINVINNGQIAVDTIYVTDFMPDALTFVSMSINGISNYQTGTLHGTDNIYISDISLLPGESMNIIIAGEVKQNANPSETINCVNLTSSVGPRGPVCDNFLLGPKPYLKKYQKVDDNSFTDQQMIVDIGDIITYRVNFSNVGSSIANNVKLADTMPKCVKYLDSSMFGLSNPPEANISQLGVDNIWYIEYNNFDLSPGQQAYIIVTGEILNDESCDTYTNISRLYFINPTETLQSQVVAIRNELPPIDTAVTLNKVGDKTLYQLGENILFTIKVENSGPNSIYDIVLQDIWPTSLSGCIEYLSGYGSGFIKNSDLSWNYTDTLHPNNSIYLYLDAKVKSDSACISKNFNNIINLSYKETGTVDEKKLVDNFEFKTPGSNVCEDVTLAGNATSLTLRGGNAAIDVTCSAPVGYGASSIAISCGNGIVSTGLNVSSYVFNCPYTTADVGLNNIVCYVDGITDDTCNTRIQIKKPGGPSGGRCGDGYVNYGEQCDNGLSSTEKLYLKAGDRLFVKDGSLLWEPEDSRRYYCQACNIKVDGGGKGGEDDYLYQPPACLGVNTPISVMKDELLPFWRNLEKMQYQNFVDSNYCVGTGVQNEDETYINQNSLKCVFAIYNSKYNQMNNNPIYRTAKLPCEEAQYKSKKIFDYFKGKFLYSHVDNIWSFGQRYFDMNDVLAKDDSNYGEYKLVLENVYFDYCDKSQYNWSRNDGLLYDRVCEVNFIVTEPYLMQKNVFGYINTNLSQSVLNSFFDLQGERLIKMTDLNSISKVDTNSYSVDYNETLSTELRQFILKYEKLALKVYLNNIPNNVTSVKKVPGQNIYILEGNGTLNFYAKNNAPTTKPFTMIVKGMDIDVQGSLKTNAMIIADGGTMTFTDVGENNYKCEEWGQTVQGIFVTTKGFIESKNTKDGLALKNTKSDELRCNFGNLIVKGILIGNNLNNLVNSKRSYLNEWFTSSFVPGSKNLLTQRRNELINGASVLIEYSPSLWSLLPPGADEFIKSLQVYKQ